MNLRRYIPEILVALVLVVVLLGYCTGLSVNKILLLFILLFVLTIGLSFLSRSLQIFFFLRKYRRTPVSEISSVHPGSAAITGSTLPEKNLRSPVTGVSCVYWHMTGEYHSIIPDGAGVAHSDWTRTELGESAAPFFTRDRTGTIRIEPQGAEMDIHREVFTGFVAAYETSGKKSATLDERALTWINSLKNDGQHVLKTHDLVSITEYYIPEGDTLYALGHIAQLPESADPTGSATREMRMCMYPTFIADSAAGNPEGMRSQWLYTRCAGGIILSVLALYGLFMVYR